MNLIQHVIIYSVGYDSYNCLEETVWVDYKPSGIKRDDLAIDIRNEEPGVCEIERIKKLILKVADEYNFGENDTVMFLCCSFGYTHIMCFFMDELLQERKGENNE